MRTYLCDWCGRTKKTGEAWILGLAAERVGWRKVRREISICSAWSDALADHPLAVHFCSSAHKDSYIEALFDEKNTHKSSTALSSRRSKRSSAVTRIGTRNSTALTAAGEVKTASATKRLSSKRTRRAAPVSKAVFTETDHIRSHGMSIRLRPGTPSTSAEPNIEPIPGATRR